MSIERALSVEKCAHHYVVETPNGPFATGRCKLCGVTRQFKNYMGDDTWEIRALQLDPLKERKINLNKTKEEKLRDMNPREKRAFELFANGHESEFVKKELNMTSQEYATLRRKIGTNIGGGNMFVAIRLAIRTGAIELNPGKNLNFELTPLEEQKFELVADSNQNDAIGIALQIPVEEVPNVSKDILQKVGAHSREHACAIFEARKKRNEELRVVEGVS